MPHWLETVLLGVVEGITEFLPISSTGHLLILEHFLGSHRSDFFNVGIQAGAVLAVVLIYWRRLLGFLDAARNPESRAYLAKLALSFGLTVVIGLGLNVAGIELPDELGPVAWAVLLGAAAIFAAEGRLKHRAPSESIGWPVAVWVGLAQVLAGVFPGTSRSAATIIAAMLLGVSRLQATEFSFLLGIPTMFAASFYLLAKAWKHDAAGIMAELPDFALGFGVSLVVAFAAVKWLLGFLRTHTFTPFAWYRLALGLGLMGWLLLK
jgi:undecaprenyl-diphosphatase